ncbi:unnamed protein product [Linum trigynum]|uniref:Uncharacterized protein n=1 Tax=Linum trigynum TaxID=586398 RepID=A0AAV2FS51_9ROSI
MTSRKENQKASPILPKQGRDSDSSPAKVKHNQSAKQGADEGAHNQGGTSPAAATKHRNPSSQQTSFVTGRTGTSKGPTAEAKTGHQPNIKQPAEGREDRHNTKGLIKNQASGEGQPRRIDFNPKKDDKEQGAESANEPMDTTSGSILEVKKSAMAVDK